MYLFNYVLIVRHLPRFREARCFYIRCMTSNYVMEVKDGVKLSASCVILHRKQSSPCPYQLWYEDETGIIRSKLNGYMIDLTGNLN